MKSTFRRTALASGLVTVAAGALVIIGPAQAAFADCWYLNGRMEWVNVPEGWSTPPMYLRGAGMEPGMRCQNGRIVDNW